jgi:hypothetical protein
VRRQPLAIHLPVRSAPALHIRLLSAGLISKPASISRFLGRVFGVKDLRRKVGAAEKVGQNVLRVAKVAKMLQRDRTRQFAHLGAPIGANTGDGSR